MRTEFRLLDTGARSAVENMALDEALLAARACGDSPDTLRFLQFSPPAVLVGYHQCLSQEARLEFCRDYGIDWNRRLTGGGAIFFDTTQLGWEIISTSGGIFSGYAFEALTEKIAQGLIRALYDGFGIKASFRPRNDIEVGGRKCSGTGGTWRDEAFLFQGTLLVDFDADLMLRALRVPVEKLKAREIESMRDRVTCLREILGFTPDPGEIKSAVVRGFEEELGVSFVPGNLTSLEKDLFHRALPVMKSEEWRDRVPARTEGSLTASYASRSGLIRLEIALTPTGRNIQNAFITGDLFCRPSRAIYDLEAALKGCRLDEEKISNIVDEFFLTHGVEIPYGGAEDVKKAFGIALQRIGLLPKGFALGEANDLFPVVLPFTEILKRPLDLVLLPYCAKDGECGHRHGKDCLSCGRCSTGKVYDEARKRGLHATTIVSFEDLRQTLSEASARGVRAFVGSCCEAFYNKHREDFERLGVPGILVDIDSITCYDLGKSGQAYRGEFDTVTSLRADLIIKTMDSFTPA